MSKFLIDNGLSILVYAIGIYASVMVLKQELKDLKEKVNEDLARIEEKQDKHNKVVERTFILETEVKNIKKILDKAGL